MEDPVINHGAPHWPNSEAGSKLGCLKSAGNPGDDYNSSWVAVDQIQRRATEEVGQLGVRSLPRYLE